MHHLRIMQNIHLEVKILICEMRYKNCFVDALSLSTLTNKVENESSHHEKLANQITFRAKLFSEGRRRNKNVLLRVFDLL